MAKVEAYGNDKGKDSGSAENDTGRVTLEDSPPSEAYEGRPMGQLAVAWAVVGIPLAYGLIATIIKALPLFR